MARLDLRARESLRYTCIMSKLLDFIASRRPVLLARKQELSEELESVLRELTEFDLAEEAVKGKLVASEVAKKEQDMTIKQMVVDVLGVLPDGADAFTILRHINSRFGAGLARESLSPQLSRLKRANVIRLDGRVWFLNEKGPAEAGPSKNVGAVVGARVSPSQQSPEGSIPSASTPSLSNGDLLRAAE